VSRGGLTPPYLHPSHHTPHHVVSMDYETRHRSFELMSRHGGGFCQKLSAAWFAADTGNKARIEAAFPDYMAEYGPDSQFWKGA
jgi:hypothetical protein